MKKFLVYLCSIVVAVILGGVIGNLCAGIAPLSWLDYAPPLHLKSHTWNLYVADLTFGIQLKTAPDNSGTVPPGVSHCSIQRLLYLL